MNIETVLSVVTLICYFLSHLVQYLPVSVTEKVPDAVMKVINVMAAKHGSQEAAKTDLAGNPV